MQECELPCSHVDSEIELARDNLGMDFLSVEFTGVHSKLLILIIHAPVPSGKRHEAEASVPRSSSIARSRIARRTGDGLSGRRSGSSDVTLKRT